MWSCFSKTGNQQKKLDEQKRRETMKRARLAKLMKALGLTPIKYLVR
jgi:hypothetical protein